MIRTRIFICIFLVSLCICIADVQADIVDLTTAGSSGTLNGALFYEAHAASTGTGLIQSFVRIQATGVEEGYNTDYRPLQYDELTSATFTHSLSLSGVPIVYWDGIPYREFLLDINENGPGTLLSLDAIEIYQGSVGNLTGHSTGVLPTATLVYDMDAGSEGDSWIKLDYSLNSGSGSGDMYAYIPNSQFSSNPEDADYLGDYVYLYSKFGSEFTAVAGPEEWAVRLLSENPGIPVVPVPAALLIGILGMGVTGLKLRKFA